MEGGLGEMLMKVAMFALVQALVYLILTKSSSLFSRTKTTRSYSFRPARSVSVRRILAALQDMPSGGEKSPPSTGSLSSPSSQDGPTTSPS